MVFSVLARFRLAFQDFDIHFPPEFCLGHLPFTRIRVLINTHTFQPVIYRNFPRHSLCFIPEQLRNIRDNFNIIQKIPKHSRKKVSPRNIKYSRSEYPSAYPAEKKHRTSPAAPSYCLGFAPNFISKSIISQFPV